MLLFLFVPETFRDRSSNPNDLQGSQRRDSSTIENGVHGPELRKTNATNADARPDNFNMDGPRDFRLHLEMPPLHDPSHAEAQRVVPGDVSRPVPLLHNLNSPFYVSLEENQDYLDHHLMPSAAQPEEKQEPPKIEATAHVENPNAEATQAPTRLNSIVPKSKDDPAKDQDRSFKTFLKTLKPWSGRLNDGHWFLIMLRPFILFSYPSILWSIVIYSLSTAWLDVLLRSVAQIYQAKELYHFSTLDTGLIYLSPFAGTVFGTVVSGKLSDIMIRHMSRRNRGIYEPEFRLLMAIPIGLTTAIGLMGFGCSISSESHDLKWIIPIVFLGLVAFGTSLAATTAITFCLDSHRRFAVEAMVALSFGKNILLGVPFSLFFDRWVRRDGFRMVGFVGGGLILGVMLLATIPMYLFGKRGRKWVAKRGLTKKF